jgi:hypothetical protein
MRASLAVVILFLCGQMATQDALQPLVDFAACDSAQKWQAVNDGVMGGVPDGRLRTPEDKTLEFFGTLSLRKLIT